MNYFLSDERRTKLTEALTGTTVTKEGIERMVNIPDDMMEVDLAMTAHVMAISMFRDKNESKEVTIGLAVLVTIMQEARERGLAETDFPMCHEAIQDDLAEHYGHRRNVQ